MLTLKSIRVFTAFVLVTAAGTLTLFGAEGPGAKNGQGVRAPNQVKAAAVLNINNLVSWYRANGLGQYGPSNLQGDGSSFPRGTSHPFFADGLVWGGKAYLDAAHTQPAPIQVIRVGGNTYNSGNREGWIVGTGANAVPVSASDPRARIYRVRRDYASMSESELENDALENFYWGGTLGQVTSGDVAAVTAQYLTDWNEWPVDLGAPYIERNGTAGYQAPPPFSDNFTVDSLISGSYDEPGLAGADPNSPADQVMWCVGHDLDPGAMLPFTGSESMGIEMQLTIWGYKRTDALGNLFFKRVRLINKGGVDIDAARTQKGFVYVDSMYIAQWADPDLGDAGDDLVGCDTALSVGYIYNGNAGDTEYKKFGLPPPSAGYDFLAGPIVASPGDSAVFDLKRRYGYKNLKMSSFAWFASGSAISDPPFDYEGALRWYKMLRGYVPDPSTQPDRFYPVEPGYTAGYFPLSGDPTTGQGLLDGQGTTYSFAPGDRRLVLCSGPFTLAAGDTQEVVIGQVAGIGNSRSTSISVMKFNDRFVQNTFDALFEVPKPPDPPNVKVAETDGQVSLEWGSDFNAVSNTEDKVNYPGAFKFEGYNIYQLSSASSTLESATRIATYDLVTDPTVILDKQFDVKSGQILDLPVQYGSNSGIVRHFNFKRDYIRDIDKLWNGQEYYLVVTAYSVSTIPDYLPATLESPLRVLTVRPKIPYGQVYGTATGQSAAVVHTSATILSDGSVDPLVVDPSVSTGKTYNVKFKVVPTTFAYGPDTTGATDTVLYDQLNWYLISGSDTLFTGVNQGPTVPIDPGTANLSPEIPQKLGDLLNYPIIDGVFLSVLGPTPQLNASRSGYISGTDWTSAGGSGRFAPSTSVLDGQVTTAYDISLLYLGAVGPGVTPDRYRDIEFRFGDSGSVTQKAYRYRRIGTYQFQDYVNVPFQVWEMADPQNPRQLNCGWRDNNNNGAWDPTGGVEVIFIATSTYDGDSPTTFTYSTTPGDATNSIPVGDYQYCAEWISENGLISDMRQSVVAVSGNRVLSENDVYTFTLPAHPTTVPNEKASVDKIKVFPNPYYAFNPAETNRFVRFVTFNNVPPKVKIRIFNLAGQLVRTIDKDNSDQFQRWDLNNQDNFPVASGIYIAHLECTMSSGEIVNKVLKIAVILEQEVPDTYGERTFQ